VLGPDGPVGTPSGEGVVVPSGGRVAVLLDAVAPNLSALAVHVEARTGRVAATLHDELVRGLTPGGTDGVTPAQAPARRQVVPGVVVISRDQPDDPAAAGATALRVAVLGGPSGTGLEHPEELARLVGELGLRDVATLQPPVPRTVLADWYRAADLVAVPSYSESFGLVALEAQACGTPVVAARVGGLRTAVRDGVSGLLVDGHDPHDWAAALGGLLDDPVHRAAMQVAAVSHAGRFSWDATVEQTLRVYAAARARSARLRGLERTPAPRPAPAGTVAVAP